VFSSTTIADLAEISKVSLAVFEVSFGWYFSVFALICRSSSSLEILPALTSLSLAGTALEIGPWVLITKTKPGLQRQREPKDNISSSLVTHYKRSF
jgi:hypothetical protein